LGVGIVLAAYDTEWPRLFENEARRIRAALGEGALAIEHVGSTSVPGLTAKPVIDIVLAVENSAREAEYAGALEAEGYRLRIREPEWFDHRMFRSAAGDVNLHVFSAGCTEIGRMVTFRDRLRANRDDRDRYARCKIELAQREWSSVDEYAQAKTGIIEEILSRTRDKLGR
jgi:GrpB-like predicted nucleotidyltransferase (UPF0157 family)